MGNGSTYVLSSQVTVSQPLVVRGNSDAMLIIEAGGGFVLAPDRNNPSQAVSVTFQECNFDIWDQRITASRSIPKKSTRFSFEEEKDRKDNKSSIQHRHSKLTVEKSEHQYSSKYPSKMTTATFPSSATFQVKGNSSVSFKDCIIQGPLAHLAKPVRSPNEKVFYMVHVGGSGSTHLENGNLGTSSEAVPKVFLESCFIANYHTVVKAKETAVIGVEKCSFSDILNVCTETINPSVLKISTNTYQSGVHTPVNCVYTQSSTRSTVQITGNTVNNCSGNAFALYLLGKPTEVVATSTHLAVSVVGNTVEAAGETRYLSQELEANIT